MTTAATTDGRVLRGEATRERVLDAAERCFGERGYDDVSIRQIATEAGVTLGVIGFHGGSKQDLFRIVLERRVETLNAARRLRLAALMSRPDLPDLRALIDAYLTPYLDIASRGDQQWRAYARLIARIATDDRWYGEMRPLYDPVAHEYLAVIGRLHPNAGAEKLAAALTLTVASMLSLVASRIRIAGLSSTPDRGSPLEYREMLVDFCTGGFERMLG